ncbi:MAG: response regulator transcription factor, partial [Arenimonas sp.]|uniref:helix-turn-helix transcriptional regulator n=1 Tax=Arenimonas sp. TaxID=1872635 RepID=UPI0025BED126
PPFAAGPPAGPRHADSQRLLRGLGQAAQCVLAARDPAELAGELLSLAAGLAGSRTGAVLGKTAAGVRVIAALGGARPVGATVPGAAAWPALRAVAGPASATRPALSDWCLDPQPRTGLDWLGSIGGPGGRRGLLILRLDAAPAESLDQALCALAAILAAAIATAPARRPSRRQDARHEALTARERQVLALLPRGLSNPELAAALGVAPATIKTHVEGILRKLQCRDRTQAAVLAVERGWAA